MPRRIAPPHGPAALDQLRELVDADGRPKAKIAESIGMSRATSAVARRFARSVDLDRRAILAGLRPPRTWADLNLPSGA